MSETVKVEKWAYPFKVGGVDATDPQHYYAALAKATDGFYPIGANGLWHGGVHFDDATGLVGVQSEVRCIADGEVVAYRIDERYPVTEYEDNQAIGSTGFVLVRHTLAFPTPTAPAPASTPAPSSGAAPLQAPAATPNTAQAPASDQNLVFYSLYMHLLDKAGYDATPTLVRPSFWVKGNYQVKASAKDPVLGLNVRAGKRGTPEYAQILTTLPRGTTVTTADSSADENWLKIVSVSPEVAGLAADTGWVFRNQMQSLGANQFKVEDKAKDAPASKAKGLNVRASASSKGAIISVLPVGTEVTLSEDAGGKYGKLASIVSGTAMPTLEADASGKLPGYVWLKELEIKFEPKQTGSVVIMDKPMKISAGTVLGRAGQYQNHNEAKARNVVHLEVFSGEDVQAFITASRAKAATLPAKSKQLVKIYKGTKLIKHRPEFNASTPPKASDDGVLIGYDLLMPVAILEALPAEKKIKVTGAEQGRAATVQWIHLEGLLGDQQGQIISGWLADQDLMTTRHNAWEWMGFDFIEDTVSNTEHLAATLHDQELLTGDEKKDYLPKVNSSATGAVKERLFSLIDANKDDRLTVEEIRAAISKPWSAQSISQLVTKRESEWLYKAEKWDALDELLGHTDSEPNLHWVAEKTRIKSLSWWEEAAVELALPVEGVVSHFHGIALLGDFASQRDVITLEMLKLAHPLGRHSYFEELLPYLNKHAHSYGLEEPRAIAHFLSQVAHESGLKAIDERGAYSEFQMKKTFGCKGGEKNFNTKTLECSQGRLRPKLWDDTSHYAGNAENLANYVYADRMGNGSEESGDGFRYRGRGLIQVTGKDAYQVYTNAHNRKYPGDLRNFVETPDLVASTLEYAVGSAFHFWFSKSNRQGVKLHELAKTGTVSEVTYLVNGGQNGFVDRSERFKRLAEHLNVKVS